MTIRLLDPTSSIAKAAPRSAQRLESLQAKRVGYLFNQHKSAQAFWQALEREIDKVLSPSAILRVYKENTWAPAPKEDVGRLKQETDYAVVGVGA
jgi:hypothetical protein